MGSPRTPLALTLNDFVSNTQLAETCSKVSSSLRGKGVGTRNRRPFERAATHIMPWNPHTLIKGWGGFRKSKGAPRDQVTGFVGTEHSLS